MQQLNRETVPTGALPIKVIQFGDGNFLRGFVDYVIERLNQKGYGGGVAVIKNRLGAGMETLTQQQGLFTLFAEGIENGQAVRKKQLVHCLQQCISPYEDYEGYLALAEGEALKVIVSNTTEAGIYFDTNDSALYIGPHRSFPAKLTALLYRRFNHFKGDGTKGLIILPCELIENNGYILKDIVLQYARLWQLGDAFVHWVNHSNSFHNTLVDRIVSGYPKNNAEQYTSQLPYTDNLITICEPYLFWAIEGDEALTQHFPLQESGENILITTDITPYRTRKVRILNGAHTLLAQVSLLAGNATVGESMEDAFCQSFLTKALDDEILPTVPLPYNECVAYTAEVLDRFRNPYLKHYLTDIALNSVSKFRARLLPVMADYYTANGVLPQHLVFALGCLICAYNSNGQGNIPAPRDEGKVLSIFKQAWQQQGTEAVVDYILQNVDFTAGILPVEQLGAQLNFAINAISAYGAKEGFLQFKETLVRI